MHRHAHMAHTTPSLKSLYEFPNVRLILCAISHGPGLIMLALNFLHLRFY
jgi:hypothetical protein